MNTYKSVPIIKYMELIIKISGTASLKELYQNPMNRMYYAVVSATAEAEEAGKYTPTKIDIEVPITAAQYEKLKKELSESDAEESILRVSGNLELILDSACIN